MRAEEQRFCPAVLQICCAKSAGIRIKETWGGTRMPENVESLTVVSKLLDMARLDPEYLKELDRLRQPVVVLFSDIHGSTAYFEEHGDAAGLLMVHSCNGTVRRSVEKHQGRVIKSIGDGMMATFADPIASVQAAIEIQKILGEVNDLRPKPERVGVRIGIHYGAGILRANDVFGDVVNMASRVESAAAPGQIVISDALFKEVREAHFITRELGRFKLKGKTNDHSLYEVIWNQPSAPASKAPEVAPGVAQSAPQFRIQLMKSDGSVAAEHPVVPQLTIGRTQGDLRFTADASMAPLNARFVVQDGQLFVEDLSDGLEKIFIRLTGGHTLQTGDVIIMGQQVFRFREVAGAMSAVTQLGISMDDLHKALDKPVAELILMNSSGQTAGTCPISSVETQFGRTRGQYTFPADNMMSRLHARLLQRGEDFLLEDAGSRNGTFVNVRGKTSLVESSAVVVGSQLFRVKC